MADDIELKRIVLKFPRKLTEHEENILIANMKSIPTGFKIETDKVMFKLERKRFTYLRFMPGGAAALEYLKARCLMMGNHATDYFRLEKRAPDVYAFAYAWEELKTLKARFNILGHALQVPEPSLMNEGKVKEGLRRYVFGAMGFKAEEVEITEEE